MKTNCLCRGSRQFLSQSRNLKSRRLRIRRLSVRNQYTVPRHMPARPPTISPRVAATLMDVNSVTPFSFSLPPRVEKLRVAVDVDEVLGQFLVALNLFCKEQYGLNHDVEDYHVYHFATVWGCSQEESNSIVHEFFKSTYFRELPLVPGAFEALCEMQEWCDLHVVTSRQHVIRDITIQWLEQHYPGIFTSVQFGNHFALEGRSKPKSEICKEINADILIDDNPDYAIDCASSGMHVILYNWCKSYPWSNLNGRKGNSRIQEVTCWSHIPSALREFRSERKIGSLV